ncbi:hypothetical protein EVAR_26731_1 [Eumeta japonica]|uniref:Uncharacterized protein n=1 Tax=Eumeta variegata TaxID=151549 RepID=A0A4C1XD79_EUMVA|nr:hypothetical protein EVAR_26731_1 [Eumeta japonica]
MATNSFLTSIPKLKGRENYDEWAFAAENLLILEGVADCIKQERSAATATRNHILYMEIPLWNDRRSVHLRWYRGIRAKATTAQRKTIYNLVTAHAKLRMFGGRGAVIFEISPRSCPFRYTRSRRQTIFRPLPVHRLSFHFVVNRVKDAAAPETNTPRGTYAGFRSSCGTVKLCDLGYVWVI